MKFQAADFNKIQISVLIAIVFIATGGTAVYFAMQAHKTATLERNAAQSTRNDYDGKLRRVRSEEDEIKNKSALFTALQARGVIGEEQRLEWVELLKEIRDQRKLISLQYDIEPQRALGTPNIGELSFYASTLRLQLKLLHEEDLTRFLSDLQQKIRAITEVKECRIQRLPRGGAENSLAQLQADCRIDLVTLHEAPSNKP